MDNVMAVDVNNLQIYELREEVFNSKILNVKLGHQENLSFGEIRYSLLFVEAEFFFLIRKLFFYKGTPLPVWS